MNFKDFERKLFSNRDFRKEYERKDLRFEISQSIIELRLYNGLTQEQLAVKLGTRQPSIARIESGRTLPSLSFLKKIADEFNTELIPPKFSFLENIKVINNTRNKSISKTVAWANDSIAQNHQNFVYHTIAR